MNQISHERIGDTQRVSKLYLPTLLASASLARSFPGANLIESLWSTSQYRLDGNNTLTSGLVVLLVIETTSAFAHPAITEISIVKAFAVELEAS